MRIGREGYFLLVDGNNEIIRSPENEYNGEKPDLNVDLRELTESGRMAEDTVYGVSSYVRVPEACNPEGELFQENRMIDALNEDTALPVEDIDASVRRAVKEFAQDEPQSDDITTLVFRYKKG